MNEETLFERASQLPVEERAAFLARECPDAAMRARVEGLLAADADSRWMAAHTFRPAEGGPEAIGAAVGGTTREDSIESLGPGVLIGGKYALIEVIGEGGMGAVWRARQTEPVKRFVAVKLIREGMDSKQVLARFEAERQALALMDHPNIAKVLDGGIHAGRPFFVMELVNGSPITQFCDSRRLSTRERLTLFVQACQAIQHAHQKGIIHRDVKPSNVLVAHYDDRPIVKVIDFGVAKATGGTLTELTIDTGFGGIVGTPQYMSPEQASLNNVDIDTRSDIYSLGVLLYELLTGSPPFTKKELEKKGFMEILRIVREDEPPRPSTRLSRSEALPSISAERGTEPKTLTGLLKNELDWVVMKALEKDRSRRYETANGFAADVIRYLSGEAVLAHPPSSIYRLKKLARRYRVQVIAASLVLSALVAGIIGTTFGLMEARRQARIARAEAAAREMARAEEEKQRNVAEKSYRQARAAVDDYFTLISEDRLLNVPGLQPLRRDLLDAAVKYYRDFLKERGDDPVLRAEAARASFRVGWVSAGLGEDANAQAAYRNAIELYERLVQEKPDQPEYRRLLAITHGAMGLLDSRFDRKDQAIAQHRRAIEIRKTIAAERPDDPLALNDVARSSHNISLVLRDEGKPDDALAAVDEALRITAPLLDRPLPPPSQRIDLTGRREPQAIVREDLAGMWLHRCRILTELKRLTEANDAWQRSRELFETLVRDRPQDLALNALLADCYDAGHLVAMNGAQYDEAKRRIRRCLEIREAMAVSNPSILSYRTALAEGLKNFGYLEQLHKDDAAALVAYRKAVQLCEAILADHPDHGIATANLSYSLSAMGELLSRKGQKTDGLNMARRAVQLLEPVVRKNPNQIFFVSSLSGTYRKLGRTEFAQGNASEALEAFRRGRELCRSLADKYPGERYNEACFQALMVPVVPPEEREAQARLAVETLRQAFTEGYRMNRERLADDEDLKSLIDRDDFRKLDAEIATEIGSGTETPTQPREK